MDGLSRRRRRKRSHQKVNVRGEESVILAGKLEKNEEHKQ